jgi:hypothetical protein
VLLKKITLQDKPIKERESLGGKEEFAISSKKLPDITIKKEI